MAADITKNNILVKNDHFQHESKSHADRRNALTVRLAFQSMQSRAWYR